MTRRNFIGLVSLLPFTSISIKAEEVEYSHEMIASHIVSTKDNTDTFFTREVLSAFEDILDDFEDRCVIC